MPVSRGYMRALYPLLMASLHMVAPKACKNLFSFPLPTWHPSLPRRWSVDGSPPPPLPKLVPVLGIWNLRPPRLYQTGVDLC